MISLFLILTFSVNDLRNRECNIVCIAKKYNGGMYDKKMNDCLCFDRYDYFDCVDPIRLPLYIAPNIPESF